MSGSCVDREERGVVVESELAMMLRRQCILGFSWLVPYSYSGKPGVFDWLFQSNLKIQGDRFAYIF